MESLSTTMLLPAFTVILEDGGSQTICRTDCGLSARRLSGVDEDNGDWLHA